MWKLIINDNQFTGRSKVGNENLERWTANPSPCSRDWIEK
jgi:hypothetical protein